MTKDEAIKFIEKCSETELSGFFVVAVSQEDIVNKCDVRTNTTFNNFDNSDKEKFLSNVADELRESYEYQHFSDDFNEINMYGVMDFKRSF